MKRLQHKSKYTWLASILIVCILSVGAPCFADDTCVFMSTSDDLPPLIVILFDNGVEMQKIESHSSYDPNANYTPGDPEELDPAKGNATLGTLKLSSVIGIFQNDELLKGGSDVKATVNGTLSGGLLSYDAQTIEFTVGEVVTGQTSGATGTIDYIAEGNGFFHENGYGYDSGTGAILPIKDDLTLDTSYAGFKPKITVDKGALWGTFPFPGTPDKTLDFPIVTNEAWDVAGIPGVVSVTDAAGDFRYSKNYLNWLFFSGNYVGDGTDLPDKSRFYYAKLAFFKAVYATQNNAKFAIRAFSGLPGAEASGSVQPLKPALDSDPSSPTGYAVTVEFKNNVNNPVLKTVRYSPLAEGLADCAEYFNNPTIGGLLDDSPVNEYCEQLFVIVLTPGIPSSETKAGMEAEFAGVDSLSNLSADFPGLADYDGDGNDSDDAVKKSITVTKEDDSVATYEIPVNYAGTTYLDDVAHLIHTHDVVDDASPASIPGVQRVTTYTVGIMESEATKVFLRNVANNGNGNPGLYDEDNPEYGKGHFSAKSPEELGDALQAAINAIVERTSSFTAPVVPVTRTMSGNRIYLAFFKPNQDNFWEGNITKFGLSEYGQVLDKFDEAASYPNGAMIEDAEPHWATKTWADIDGFYQNRHIYTYLGDASLTAASNEFIPGNLSGALLGNPAYTASDVEKIVYYVRGKDVYDKDGDGTYAENREIVCGDALHSEPLVLRYDDTKTVIYFGANDGMLHTVDDNTGEEMWGFIPPDQLHRLRLLVEGAGHEYFVDSSPRVYKKDANNDGDYKKIDGDKIILICGERKGGNSYFALDVSDPDNPEFLWRVSGGDPAGAVGIPAPTNVIGELGETWSEPVFGRVKSASYEFGGEFDVFFVGGGYSADNSKGNTVLAIDVLTGETVRQFRKLAGGSEVTACPDMLYCIPSPVTVVYGDADNLVDKIYVGDVGGQLWRLGEFESYAFPDCDEDIDNWDGEALFQTGCGEIDCGTAPDKDEDGDGVFNERRPFYYPPTVCLENGFDLVFAGTGDREAPCLPGTYDGFYCIKDTHAQPWTEFDEDDPAMIEVDNSLPTPATPDLKGSDKGWYVNLAPDEKILSESTVFSKVAYFTTFTPNDEKCVPGGDARLYALNYLTGHTVFDYGVIGGGIPSKPVLVITEKVQRIIVSTGSTVADPESPDTGAGPITVDTASDNRNFIYLWWQEVFN